VDSPHPENVDLSFAAHPKTGLPLDETGSPLEGTLKRVGVSPTLPKPQTKPAIPFANRGVSAPAQPAAPQKRMSAKQVQSLHAKAVREFGRGPFSKEEGDEYTHAKLPQGGHLFYSAEEGAPNISPAGKIDEQGRMWIAPWQGDPSRKMQWFPVNSHEEWRSQMRDWWGNRMKETDLEAVSPYSIGGREKHREEIKAKVDPAKGVLSIGGQQYQRLTPGAGEANLKRDVERKLGKRLPQGNEPEIGRMGLRDVQASREAGSPRIKQTAGEYNLASRINITRRSPEEMGVPKQPKLSEAYTNEQAPPKPRKAKNDAMEQAFREAGYGKPSRKRSERLKEAASGKTIHLSEPVGSLPGLEQYTSREAELKALEKYNRSKYRSSTAPNVSVESEFQPPPKKEVNKEGVPVEREPEMMQVALDYLGVRQLHSEGYEAQGRYANGDYRFTHPRKNKGKVRLSRNGRKMRAFYPNGSTAEWNWNGDQWE
jgi:hypothetical protein